MENKNIKREYNKKPDLNSKIGRFYLLRKQGYTDTEAERIAYGKYQRNAPHIKETKTYKALEKRFRDHLKEKITLSELAEELTKNIKQDQDKGAKNTAIRLAKETFEPSGEIGMEEGELKIVIKKE